MVVVENPPTVDEEGKLVRVSPILNLFAPHTHLTHMHRTHSAGVQHGCRRGGTEMNTDTKAKRLIQGRERVDSSLHLSGRLHWSVLHHDCDAEVLIHPNIDRCACCVCVCGVLVCN